MVVNLAVEGMGEWEVVKAVEVVLVRGLRYRRGNLRHPLEVVVDRLRKDCQQLPSSFGFGHVRVVDPGLVGHSKTGGQGQRERLRHSERGLRDCCVLGWWRRCGSRDLHRDLRGVVVVVVVAVLGDW